ncbi:MAG TPA: S8 family serine peptidase [Drouetiella sp.]
MRPKKQSVFTWGRLALGLSLLMSAASPSFAQPPALNAQQKAANTILVMPHKGADQDEINDALKNADGTIIKTMSNGRLTCYVVQVPPNEVQKAMSAISKDKKHFDGVQQNVLRKRNISINDPLYPQQYGLQQMNVAAGLNLKADGKGISVGVIDSGVVENNDLVGRVDTGYNTITGGAGNSDPTNGFQHGTFVSTCLAATTNNNLFGAAAANRAYIIPVNVFNGAEFTSDQDIIDALFYLEGRHVKLVNMSINSDVPNTFANQSANPVTFQAFIDFYNQGGLIFNSAGNDGQTDNSPRTQYLIVISAINANEKITNFSTRGTPLWFTAAGKNIVSSTATNTVEIADGTSFSSPYACSIAASIWSRNPGLTNAQVLNLMVNTATKPPNYAAKRFGFGIPNLGAAVGSH